ncbi:MAG: DUF1801 domain-containing protein [Phycisphaeraceae bacterium]|nr:DUF1801 domain-containing protein [Phycisphaeraceae bacterium]
MKSTATTVAAYLDSLPPDRREALLAVRRVILDNLDDDLQECVRYGVIGYCVPHRIYPPGHHTRPELPLMYMGLSSQKNDMVVYVLFLLHNTPMREWFDKAWKKAGVGKKLHLEVSGAGCCLRFKKVKDLSLDVIGEAMRHMPVKKYLEDHAAMLTRLRRKPSAKGKKTGAGRAAKAKKSR